MERIHIADDPIFIGYLKSLLEAEGIACNVRNELLLGGSGEDTLGNENSDAARGSITVEASASARNDGYAAAALLASTATATRASLPIGNTTSVREPKRIMP